MNRKSIALWLAAGVAISATAGVVYAAVTPEGPSRTQVQEMSTRAFDRFDVNLDGKIDAGDHAVPQRARFDAADTDGNGSIGYAEFAALRPGAAFAPTDGPRAEGGWHEGGRHEGRRGDHGPRGGMGAVGLLPLVTSADGNRDGAVSQAEFSKAIMARFDRADANKDGIMTREEEFALRQAIRADHQRAPAHAPAPAPAAKAS